MRPESNRAIQDVIKLLTQSRYPELENFTSARHLTAQQIAEAINEYGRTVVFPPPGHLEIDAIQVIGKQPTTWSVRVPLWTREEGRSDLTLEMTIEEYDNRPVVNIDGIHVL